MKEVMAFIRVNKINQTKEALAEAGFPSFTCRKCLGRGKKSVDLSLVNTLLESGDIPASPKGEALTESSRLIPKRFFTLIVRDEEVKKVVNTIIEVNSTGNPGMATAGSGDVLSGILAAVLCMYLKTEEQPPMVLKAALGVYLHGLCGDLAAAEKGKLSMLAGDIIAYLPRALAICEEESKS